MSISFCVSHVRDIMTSEPIIVAPETTLQEAAQKMESGRCGFLPVGNEDRVQGIITDRDIVTRAVAAGKNPSQERVKDYMTGDVYGCYQDDTLEEAASIMQRHKVSRLIVKDGNNKIVGVLSFGNILRNDAHPIEMATLVKNIAGPICR